MRALTLIVLTMGLALVSCSGNAPTGQLGLPTQRGTAAPTAAPRTSAPGSTAAPTPSRSPGASSSPPGSPTASASASASASPAANAAVVGASGTQLSLAVTYSAPMRAGRACGTSGQPGNTRGAIDAVAQYTVSDPALQESLQSATRATLNTDCTTVTFVFGAAAPAGTFTVTASTTVDQQGNGIDQSKADARFTIADDARPQVTSVASATDIIEVRFSEPMLQIGEGSGVSMLGNYRLDGTTLTAAIVACVDAGCRAVRITLRSGALVAGRSYELRIANVVDRAGKSITPDPTTITFKAG